MSYESRNLARWQFCTFTFSGCIYYYGYNRFSFVWRHIRELITNSGFSFVYPNLRGTFARTGTLVGAVHCSNKSKSLSSFLRPNSARMLSLLVAPRWMVNFPNKTTWSQRWVHQAYGSEMGNCKLEYSFSNTSHCGKESNKYSYNYVEYLELM